MEQQTILLIVAVIVLGFFLVKSKEKFINTNVGAVVFEHADLKGKYVKLRPGKYTMEALAKLGMPNNTISSVKVMPNFQIKAFEHNNFQGRHIIFDKSVNYVGKDWNDKITSLHIRRKPPVGAIVFEHADFKGRFVQLRAGKYTMEALAKLGMPNDTISSVKVMPKFQIKAFEHNNFQGRHTIFGKSANYIGKDWNDKISSIQVVRKHKPKHISVKAPTPIALSLAPQPKVLVQPQKASVNAQAINVIAKAQQELKQAEVKKVAHSVPQSSIFLKNIYNEPIQLKNIYKGM